MTLILHCGFHKTGTTSFQVFLAQNRSHFPQGFTARLQDEASLGALHKAILAYCRKPRDPQARRVKTAAEAFARTLPNAGQTLVSMESLLGAVPDHRTSSQCYPHGAKLLAIVTEACADHNPALFFSTRAEQGWIKSVHSHRVATRGLTMPLADFAALPKYQNLNWTDQITALTAGLNVPVHRADMGTDLADFALPCATALRLWGLALSDWRAWTPALRENSSLKPEQLARMQNPWIRILPAPIRRRLLRRPIKG